MSPPCTAAADAFWAHGDPQLSPGGVTCLPTINTLGIPAAHGVQTAAPLSGGGPWAPHVPPHLLEHLNAGGLEVSPEPGQLVPGAQELAVGLLPVLLELSPALCQPLLPGRCLLCQGGPRPRQRHEMGQHGRDVLELRSVRGERAGSGTRRVPRQDRDPHAHLPCPGHHVLQVVAEAAEALCLLEQALPMLPQRLQLPEQPGGLVLLPRHPCPDCPLQRPLPPHRRGLQRGTGVSGGPMARPAPAPTLAPGGRR